MAAWRDNLLHFSPRDTITDTFHGSDYDPRYSILVLGEIPFVILNHLC